MKQALLSYIQAPFRLPPEHKVEFSNAGIARSWMRVLKELGYEVDVIEWNDTSFRSNKTYDLFVGHGGANWEYLRKNVVGDCARIYFSTGSYWQEHNRAEVGRFESLKQRRGISLPYDRLITHSEEFANQDADGIIALGNADVAKTYAKFPLCISVNNGVYADDHFDRHPKDYESGRRRFVFFGGVGSVHKGLDRLIEAFAGLDADLICTGRIENEFAGAYQLSKQPFPNVKFVGWIPLKSTDFYQLMDACNHVIFPSCAEGQPGSVLECMNQGLIPIISRASHIDVHDCGTILETCSVEEIRENVQRAMAEPVESLRDKSIKTRQIILRDHAEETFCENLKSAVQRVAQKAAKRQASPRIEVAPGKRRIVVDGVIFQLQAERPLGVSRVWSNMLPRLTEMLPDFEIVMLRRKGHPLPPIGLREVEVPVYPYAGPENLFDEDEAMLEKICSEMGAGLFLSTYYSHARGIPNVLTLYDMIPAMMGFDLSQPQWVAKRRAIEKASAFISISDSTRRDLARFYPANQKPVHVAHLGVTSAFRPASPQEIAFFQAKYKTDAPYFLLVGNRGLYKNAVPFLEAFTRLPENKNLQIIAIGGEAYLLPAEAPYANHCSIHFIPWLPDEELRAAYSGALALVYPSRYEGFGLPILEAMACGCPVITTKLSSIPEVAGDAALYIDPDSVSSIHEALKQILMPQVRDKLFEKGLARAKTFRWELFAREFAGLIREQAIPRETVSRVEKHDYLVSAIVSVYACERFIRGCLDDLLNQTLYKKGQLEIVLVNTASPGNEDAIIREYQSNHPHITYIKTDMKESVYGAWNRGIQAAVGKYITNANSDDRHRADCIEVLVEKLEKHPEHVLAYGDMLVTRIENETFEKCTPCEHVKWPDFDRNLLLQTCYVGPQPVWRKSVHQEFGYFDTRFECCADYEFWLRLAQKHSFIHVPEFLSLYWLDEGTVSRKGNKPVVEAEEIKAIYRTRFQNAQAHPARPVKILIVAHSFVSERRGGVEIYTSAFARGLAKKGFAVSIFHPVDAPRGQPLRLEHAGDGPLHLFRLHANESERLSLDLHVENKPIEELFEKLLKEELFDAVHFQHLAGLPFSLVDIARKCGARVCITLHDSWFMCERTHLYVKETHAMCTGPETATKCADCRLLMFPEQERDPHRDMVRQMMQLRQDMAKRILHQADLLAAPSNYIARQFQKFGYASSVEILPLGIELLQRNAAKKKGSEIVFGCLGSIAPVKNVHMLVRVFRQVHGPAKLVLWGEAIPAEQKRLQEEIGSDTRIEYRGAYRPEQLSEILGSIDALILPSMVESYSFVAREALSAGVPVIASNAGALPEIVTDRRNGLLFESNHPAALQGCIQEVIDHPEILDSLRKAETHVQSLSQNVDEWALRYIQLCNRSVTHASASPTVSTPLLSAIVSVYNCESFIRGCLEDLVAQTLFQKNRMEIILVNTGSQQNEDPIIQEFAKKYSNIRSIKVPERETVYAAWNRGIQASSGKYLTNANADDRHRTDALERIVDFMEALPQASVAYAFQSVTDQPNQSFETARVLGYYQWPIFDARLLFRICFVGPQPVWRRSLHNTYGYFDPKFRSAGDYEFWLRIMKHEKFLRIPEVLGLYLNNPGGVENTNQAVSLRESEEVREKHWPKEWGPRPEPGCQFFVHREEIGKPAKPLVSVIIPTRNRPKMLANALKSLAAQTFKNFEVVLINDDGDDMKPLLENFSKHFAFLYLRQSMRRERSAARNMGLFAARGKYVTYLDDDDRFYPDHLETLVNFLESHNADVAYTDANRAIQEKEGELYVTKELHAHESSDFDKDRILVQNFIPILCVMHRKACLDFVGPFNERLNTHEDWDLWIRLSRKYDFHHIRKVTAEYSFRFDGSSTTSGNRPDFLLSLKMIYDQYRPYVKDHLHLVQAQERSLAAMMQEVQALQSQQNQVSPLALEVPASSGLALSIIIPTFNKWDLTRDCLEAIKATTRAGTYEVIVVDNASTDSTPAELRKRGEAGELTAILNSKNMGFGHACNQGAKAARAKHIVFLNNDTQPAMRWADYCLAHFQWNPKAGIVGNKLLYPNGTIQHGGIHFVPLQNPPVSHWPQHRFRFEPADLPEANQCVKVHAITGACLFISRELFWKVGGFSDEYEMYFEDIDLNLKIMALGFDIIYEPRSVVIHFERSSATEQSANEKFVRAANIFLSKWENKLPGMLQAQTLAAPAK